MASLLRLCLKTTCDHLSLSLSPYLSLSISVSLYLSIYLSLSLYIYIYIYINNIYVYTYIYIYIYIYICMIHIHMLPCNTCHSAPQLQTRLRQLRSEPALRPFWRRRGTINHFPYFYFNTSFCHPKRTVIPGLGLVLMAACIIP